MSNEKERNERIFHQYIVHEYEYRDINFVASSSTVLQHEQYNFLRYKLKS
jgi:hypothetical protein